MSGDPGEGRAPLSPATLPQLPSGIERPGYDRSGLTPGILHFGPGAFHRAHQAVFVDDILARDPRWAVSAVGLNSTAVAQALAPQEGLYTLAVLAEEARFRVIGSLVERPTLHDRGLIEARLGAPTTRLITATVTEKGYGLGRDGQLDREHPAIAADLRQPDRPRSYIGWLAHGLRLRRAAGAGGVTVLSCDNLAANGQRQRRALLDYAALVDPDLARWIKDEVRFPNTMVDAITPATDDRLRHRVAAALGLHDAWPVQREPFSQWVIEDDFRGERPPFDEAGVHFVPSVEAFEWAKLRLLNGAHSTLAYVGLLLGHETVSEAMADPVLAAFVERLMREDIVPTLPPGAGLDPPAYISTILARFRNSAVRHSLWQIASDGSQKLPFRLVATLVDARAAERPVGRLALPLAAWFRFLRLPRPPAPALVDPRASALLALAASGDVDALIDESGLLPGLLRADPIVRSALREAYQALTGPGAIREALFRG